VVLQSSRLQNCRGEQCQAITARRVDAGFYGYHALLFLQTLLPSGSQEKIAEEQNIHETNSSQYESMGVSTIVNAHCY
jgi:hypothetical protein